MYNCGTEHKVGDLVRFNKGEYAGKLAVIEYTYDSKYGGGDNDSLGLCFEDGCGSSWWYPSQLDFICRGKLNLVQEWKDKAYTLKVKVSNLDYIFNNLDEVLENGYTASLQSVFTLIGGGCLWGNSGEGVNFYTNAYATFTLLTEFNNSKETKSKENFIEFSKKFLNNGDKHD